REQAPECARDPAARSAFRAVPRRRRPDRCSRHAADRKGAGGRGGGPVEAHRRARGLLVGFAKQVTPCHSLRRPEAVCPRYSTSSYNNSLSSASKRTCFVA